METEYERKLLGILDSFLRDEVGFDAFVERFDQCYFRESPEEEPGKHVELFFDEVNESVTVTGGFGPVSEEEFKVWLGRARQCYPETPDPLELKS
jgi:hypothetical protein